MAMRAQFEDFEIQFPKGKTCMVRKNGGDLKPVKMSKVFKSEHTGLHRIGMVANKHGRPGNTLATQFMVVNGIGCSPSANWGTGKLTGGNDIYVGFTINTTDYFVSAHGVNAPGVSGLISPYPDNGLIGKTFQFNPSVYVLPGQIWEVVLSFGDLKFAWNNPVKSIRAYISYTLYDGPECLIANKLLETGITVTPSNIDWWKRKEVEKRLLAATKFEDAKRKAREEAEAMIKKQEK